MMEKNDKETTWRRIFGLLFWHISSRRNYSSTPWNLTNTFQFWKGSSSNHPFSGAKMLVVMEYFSKPGGTIYKLPSLKQTYSLKKGHPFQKEISSLMGYMYNINLEIYIYILDIYLSIYIKRLGKYNAPTHKTQTYPSYLGVGSPSIVAPAANANLTKWHLWGAHPRGGPLSIYGMFTYIYNKIH